MVLQCFWHPRRYWYVVKMLVTPDVREPMLSFAWLSENQVCWDFTRNALYMHGRFIPLIIVYVYLYLVVFVIFFVFCRSSFSTLILLVGPFDL